MVQKRKGAQSREFLFQNNVPQTFRDTNQNERKFSAKRHSKEKEPSLTKALSICFGPYFMLGGFYKLVSDVISFINPQLLRYSKISCYHLIKDSVSHHALLVSTVWIEFIKKSGLVWISENHPNPIFCMLIFDSDHFI